MIRNKKIAIAVFSVLIVYAIVGFVVVPLVLESVLPEKLSEQLNREVKIENIYLNPFTLVATVSHFTIQGRKMESPLFSIDEMAVNAQWASLFKLAPVLKEVRLIKPDIHLVRLNDTEFNFSDLIVKEEAGEEKEAEINGEKPFQFSVSNVSIIDGNISFEDKTIQKEHHISGINLNLPEISNFDTHIETFSLPRLSGNLNKAGFSVDVETKPFHDSLETIAHITVTGVELPYYFGYVPEDMVGFEILSGMLNVDFHISFIQKEGEPEITAKGNIDLTNMEISDKKHSKVFAVKSLQVDIAPSHPLKNKVAIASVKISSPEVIVTRSAEGVINLTTLGPPSSPEEKTAADTPAAEEAAKEDNPSESPFLLDISEFKMDSGTIVFKDFASSLKGTAVETTLGDINISMSGFSNSPDKLADFDINALVNKTAVIKIGGKLGVTPLSVETDCSVNDVKLAWAQPYLPDTVKLFLKDGSFEAANHIILHTEKDGELAGTVTGRAGVNHFKSFDASRKEPFVSFDAFSFEGIDVSLKPLAVSLDQILLKNFSNQLVILKDGTTSIEKIFASSAPSEDGEEVTPEAPPEETESTSFPIKIGEVVLANFGVAFADKSISPQFSTGLNLSELRVKGLTSENFKAADIIGEGQIDAYAPVKIRGSVNPLGKDLFLDITCGMKNMEMSPLSPYTGKYIGRMIEKGKLNLDLQYKIQDKNLSASNRILLDQFTLGEKVESEDAVDLPVGIAISLLKDRAGQINVDMPVKGRIDDPEFKLGKTLLKTFTNLIIKAAASPFDFIGAVVGGGKELRYIEFDPASYALTDASKEKLDAVKKLLYERPALGLDISGFVDMENDLAALKNRMLLRKIKIRTLKKGDPQDDESLDNMELTAEEYNKYLKKEYDDVILSDPEKKNTAKSLNDPELTPEEMASLIENAFIVPREDLRALAMERSRQVRAYLLEDGSTSPDRVFLKEVDAASPEKKESFRSSRVELNVRK